MKVLTGVKASPATWRAGEKSSASRNPSGPRAPRASSAVKLAAARFGAISAASAVAYGAITSSPGGVRRRASRGTPCGAYW